ncbi:BaiN/RdsA family NAD(P)/FAD-dependent oxidoreductase [Natronincola ferrireducens]|uniref:Uncharacterized protein n=1 Tax=Natronincola ferrireducens TaxID=393762 RepID=A0A1G9ADR1_9FIRM|nr:NAD(P)/FAD-dependent oxidoreductase [Natronincola ferrireducens]SDK24665.1 hypothetical protein SAMN05660472_01119 [Natronincola ferrireducens]
MINKKIIVVGAGPAGMMAAITAAQHSNHVILIEKNATIGKKLSITGGGRCNITNNSSPEEIMKNIITNHKFLYKSLHSFTSKQVMELLETNGCPIKIEEKEKVFPLSEKSADVIKVFEKLLAEHRVKVYFECQLKDIFVEDDRIVGIETNHHNKLECDALILATGGVSYPITGSTGEGHNICEKLGHKIIPLKPSLISMTIEEKWLTEMTGIALRDIVIKTKINKKSLNFYGDLLFTHYGISGPAVFELSSYLNKVDLPKEGHEIFVDLLPQIAQDKLKELFLSADISNKQVSTLLIECFPKRFVADLLNEFNLSNTIKFNQLNKKDRNRLMETIKNFKITVLGLRNIQHAIVTSGGISVKEVNPSTMESKIIKDLYFAGELLDVDALTGGYNLQIAFSTGYIAGSNSVGEDE